MKILVVHNRYIIRSGEDSVFHKEVALLQEFGHEVFTWTVDNRDIETQGIRQKVTLAVQTIWSRAAYQEMQQKIRDYQPDIVHVHNVMPLLSPAIFYACQALQTPVVQTLHNYRLGCPVSYYSREGKVCERCREHSLLESIRYRCYQHSRLKTATIAVMLQWHRWIGTWKQKIDGYIVLSNFQSQKIVELGIPPEKLYIKPNFVQAPAINSQPLEFGSYYLFVGRLTPEKGIPLLLDAYRLAKTQFPLVIVGAGELENLVVEAAEQNSMIRYVGEQSQAQVLEWMRGAIALLFPSLWYECLPMAILEAYCCSLPVISTDLGTMPDMIQPQVTGFTFSPPTAQSLAVAIAEVEKNPEAWLRLKQNLLSAVDSVYFPEANYRRLLDIYQTICQKKKAVIAGIN
jgi:glycosyltransferase involved in cell wall biosynthesis